MGDVTYDRFRANHPEYLEVWRSAFMQTLISSDPPVIQSGFFVEIDEPEMINALVCFANPIVFYCGDGELAKDLIAAYPRFESIVRLHGWYQDSIFMVIHETTNLKE